MKQISIGACPTYEEQQINQALETLLDPFGGLAQFIKPKQKVFLKLNLVMKKNPAAAVTTHPALVAVLAKKIIDIGAIPILGDSPGGPYTKTMLKSVYQACGIEEVAQQTGALLNYNTDEITLPNPAGQLLKNITLTKCLLEADVILSLPKLKTHSMTLYTGAVKNLFGAIPGLKKAEYHLHMPKIADFADLLIDICAFIKPQLTIMDAIIGMEGDGPTAGCPRQIGALLAAIDPFALDVAAASLVGLPLKKIATIQAAEKRGLCSSSLSDLEIIGNDFTALQITDFALPVQTREINFLATRYLPNWLSQSLTNLFTAKPVFSPLKCQKCAICCRHCPPQAITMMPALPHVDLHKCIRCFCCQELCPHQAVTIKHAFFFG